MAFDGQTPVLAWQGGKYARRAGGGLIAHQHALRDYQDTTALLRGLRLIRERLVGLMAKEGLRPAPE